LWEGRHRGHKLFQGSVVLELFIRKQTGGGEVLVLIFNSPNTGQFSAESLSIIHVAKTIFVFSAFIHKQRLPASNPALKFPERRSIC
jgi:hypothetical protein